jgi:hypothetical protein
MAHRTRCIGPGILKSFAGELVQVGGRRKIVSITTQEISGIVFAGNPEDIWNFLGISNTAGHCDKNKEECQ